MDQIFRRIQRTVRDVTSKQLGAKSMPGGVKSIYIRLIESLEDKDKQLQSLTRAYVGAFSIIAILSILGHLVTVHITSNQRENAEVTFTITNLRSLVDVIVSQASAFKSSGDSFDDDLLSQSIDRMKQERTRIDAYGSDALKHIFHDPPFVLNDKIKNFINTSEAFVRDKRINQNVEATAAFTALSGETSRVIEINLDLTLDQYRTDVMQQIEHSYELQLIGVLTILLVLFLEATFIFRPLVKHLGEYHKHLLKLALTDALTGLNNRRSFIQQANVKLDTYHRHGEPFVLALMDLDHFKAVNDTYGHKVGDLVLQHFSALMQGSLRGHDVFGRIGGEEFAIFLPQITAEEALPILERCRKNVAETACMYVDGSGEAKSLNYSASFGIVAVKEGAWSLDDLFIRADEQLYKAKEQGRNCLVMKTLGSTPPSPAGGAEAGAV